MCFYHWSVDLIRLCLDSGLLNGLKTSQKQHPWFCLRNYNSRKYFKECVTILAVVETSMISLEHFKKFTPQGVRSKKKFYWHFEIGSHWVYYLPVFSICCTIIINFLKSEYCKQLCRWCVCHRAPLCPIACNCAPSECNQSWALIVSRGCSEGQGVRMLSPCPLKSIWNAKNWMWGFWPSRGVLRAREAKCVLTRLQNTLQMRPENSLDRKGGGCPGKHAVEVYWCQVPYGPVPSNTKNSPSLAH